MNLPKPTADPLATPVGFARGVLGMSLYDWQDAILWDADKPGAIAVKAGNGSGKTTSIAAPLALWHAVAFTTSLTIITAGVYRQVKEQLFPALRRHARKFQECSPRTTVDSLRKPRLCLNFCLNFGDFRLGACVNF